MLPLERRPMGYKDCLRGYKHSMHTPDKNALTHGKMNLVHLQFGTSHFVLSREVVLLFCTVQSIMYSGLSGLSFVGRFVLF